MGMSMHGKRNIDHSCTGRAREYMNTNAFVCENILLVHNCKASYIRVKSTQGGGITSFKVFTNALISSTTTSQ
jgi:hypothetical protein